MAFAGQRIWWTCDGGGVSGARGSAREREMTVLSHRHSVRGVRGSVDLVDDVMEVVLAERGGQRGSER
jgi:hypothetical protein